ncbi:hypothetical protein [Allokutzneria sp. NRRL B-24872]|uniref:hypothetical protein n=1 Tax=Allokutzneria sp. NRRL B-24872 TaxID=1137961 RepID=UPI001AEF761E|nr:hypothetical protein [Allokutzneria sp. NRRL B-24872]
MDITRLLDAALRKAAAVWVRPEGHPPRLVWALWRDGAVWLATGPAEQEVPGLAGATSAVLTVRSPSTHSHLVDVPVTVEEVEPDEAVAAALATTRLNRPSLSAPPAWTRVHRLAPTP